MSRVLSDAVTLTVAEESSFATAPSSNWVQIQPNRGGIKGWQNKYKTEERDPLSKLLTMERGEIVGQDVEPEIEHDLNKDLVDIIAGSMFRVVAKHTGNKGQTLYRPTAVTSTGYTVAADGDLTAGLLIKAQGFPTAANNGVKVVGSSSTGTEIKTSGLSAESVSATLGATVEVCGVRGASDDITMNSSGNLTSTVLDFTTLNIPVGSWIKVGGASSATQFATTAYNRCAKVTAISANLITLERRDWTVGSQDLGAGKTIELRFGRWYRNVALDDSDYREPTLHAELEEFGPGTANAATYTYGKGLALKMLTLTAPLESRIAATLSFCGKDITDPVVAASRVSGPSTARKPMAARLWHTTSPHLIRTRLATTSGDTTIAAEVNSWKWTMDHEINPREIQGERGAKDLVYGKVKPSLTAEIYYTDFALPIAIRAGTELWWDTQVRNDQAGWILDMPYVAVRGAEPTFAGAAAVTRALEVPAFRNPADNIVASMTVFPDLPEAP